MKESRGPNGLDDCFKNNQGTYWNAQTKKEWLYLLISKGMCEQVIMNEEFENEKAIKHRRRLIGKYSVDR